MTFISSCIFEKEVLRNHYFYLFRNSGTPSYPYAFVNPGDQRRPSGGQYYAEYAAIGNSGGRGGSRQDVSQHNTVQDYPQHDYGGKCCQQLFEPFKANNYNH